MTELLTSITEVSTAVMATLSDILGLFTTEPILMFFIGLTIVGSVIGMAKGLIRRKK